MPAAKVAITNLSRSKVSQDLHEIEVAEILPNIATKDPASDLMHKLDIKIKEMEILSADRESPIDPNIYDTLYDCLNEVTDYSKRISSKIDPPRFSPVQSSDQMHSSASQMSELVAKQSQNSPTPNLPS